MDSTTIRIAKNMEMCFKMYKKLKMMNKKIDNNAEKTPYWDVIVLTTYDNAQKQSFLEQLEKKGVQKDFPNVNFHVISDPPNQKLGCGGSTLHVLKTLLPIIGDQLYEKKILIIHSGGSSQRLPSYSVLGKIFSPIPVKELSTEKDVTQMIDIKLALFVPFCPLVRPGVFVTCADDIETYYADFDSLDKSDLNNADVIVLAHPSPVKLGETHGVYVLAESKSAVSVWVSDCTEVLQKPSRAFMKERGAIIKRDDGSEIVYSDSVFWLSSKICKKLTDWFINHTPKISELDAYGHFLPCFSTNFNDIKLTHPYITELYPILSGYSMKAIVLPQSRFYHMGTINEYIENFSGNPRFLQELEILTHTSNLTENLSLTDKKKNGDNTQVVISSFFDNKDCIPVCSDRMVIEWCTFSVPTYSKGNVILSNCVLKKCPSVKFLSKSIDIFSNLLYHTVAICYEKKKYYVTIAFEVDAQMKKVHSSISPLAMLSCPMEKVLKLSGISKAQFLPKHGQFSLWTLKMFSAGHSPEESFWRTHYLVSKIHQELNCYSLQTDISFCDNLPYFSMEELVEYKNMDEVLNQ